MTICLAQAGCQRRQGVILGDPRCGARAHSRQPLHYKTNTNLRETVRQSCGIVILGDGQLGLSHNVTGVQFLGQMLKSDTGFGQAGQQRVLDRRGPTERGQQAVVHVQRGHTWNRQQVRAKNTAEGYHEKYVGLQVCQLLQKPAVATVWRLEDAELASSRGLLYRRRAKGAAAAPWAVRLGNDPDDFAPGALNGL